jgi:FtsH-binding integral membrane protein
MAYLCFTFVLPSHQNVLAFWQSIAAGAIGPQALASPVYAWVGLIVHVVVSIGWAGGYAYFAQTQPFVNARWIVSGVVYGIVVYLIMLVLLLGARASIFPFDPATIANVVVAHAVFFGLPVAFVVSRMESGAHSATNAA